MKEIFQFIRVLIAIAKALMLSLPFSLLHTVHETAEKTICGIEIIHMIRKGQVEEIQCVLSEVKFFNTIMDILA